MAMVLDRYFVHRLRVVTGKDGNPLNEVEMICDSFRSSSSTLAIESVYRPTISSASPLRFSPTWSANSSSLLN